MAILKPTHLAIVVLAVIGRVTMADPTDWAEGTQRNADGANREYYNRAALLPWKNFMGDWRDADDKSQGDKPYAVADVDDVDATVTIKWDITALVDEWTIGRYRNQGMFLRVIVGGGTIIFASRENHDEKLRPKLTLEGDEGTLTLHAVADTHLTKSTYRSQGKSEELRLSKSPDHVLIRFDLRQTNCIGKLKRAELNLKTTRQYGSATVGVFRSEQGHDEKPSKPVFGIASRYSLDQGITQEKSVIFAAQFEGDDWSGKWTYVGPKDRVDILDPKSTFKKFEPLHGRALRSRIAKGSTTALNTIFKFAKETGVEPQEVYFRYYLRLGDDWNQTIQGGKLPGISGTYGRAGWGGRKSNGSNGWSARGLFRVTIPQGNPLAGRTPIGYYCYHADMKGQYGTNWIWNRDYRGYLQNNRWYGIEQYCRLNTPGKKDGILKAWIDGRLAFEKTDIRFRTTDKLNIEQIWMNVYHGGTKPSPYDQHVFIDNVVIAKEYIGPMVREK